MRRQKRGKKKAGGLRPNHGRKVGAEVTSLGWLFTLEGKVVTSVQILSEFEMGCPVS